MAKGNGNGKRGFLQTMKKPFSWLSKSGSTRGSMNDKPTDLPLYRRTEDGQLIPSISQQLIERVATFGVHFSPSKVDYRECARLRELIAERLRANVSIPHIGIYLVQIYQQNDDGLAGLITQMANLQCHPREIALAAIEIAGLLNMIEESPNTTRRQISGGAGRFYTSSNDDPTGPPSSGFAGLTLSESRVERQPYYPVQQSPPFMVRPPSWPRRIIEAAEARQREQREQEERERTVRAVQSGNPQGEDIPLLRPATLERILRGFPDDGPDFTLRDPRK